MQKTKTYRQIALLGLLTVLLLTAACTRYNFDSEEEECYLDIYVYPPDRPVVTRADLDYTKERETEGSVNTLQIWVFKSTTGELLGYLEPDMPFNYDKFRMSVSPTIVNGNDRSVDVYVLANVTARTCGHTFNRQTTRQQLDAATISGTHFGVGTLGSNPATLTQEVPLGGLPMSGVLKNAPVVGSYPALRISNGIDDEMAKVKLARVVSKLRIVLCRVENDDNNPAAQLHSIDGIQIDGGQIPTHEYLMLDEPFNNSLNPSEPLAASRIRIQDTYESAPISFGAVAVESIPVVDDPLDYLYNSTKFASLEAYETKIIEWSHPVSERPATLLDLGVTYLRESDKRLTGAITYKTEDNLETPKIATFQMDRAGDFTRDHSWIVYAFFSGGRLQVFNVVQVGIKTWTVGNTYEREFYNW